MRVSGAGVSGAYRRREELKEAPGGGFARTAEYGRESVKGGTREGARWDWHELGTHGREDLISRRRIPNSSGSKKSAGSMSSSTLRSGVRFLAGTAVLSFRLCRFLRSSSFPDWCLITSRILSAVLRRSSPRGTAQGPGRSIADRMR